MAQTTEGGATEEVEKILFNFMTNEEVKRHSVVKIINPLLLDSLGRPIPAGLYDPAMGPFDEISSCKSCGQRAYNCPGHCGHIELVSPVYNPLLFNRLYNLLQRICFFCFRFRADREEVDRCVSRLKLISKGDVIGSRNLDSTDSPNLDASEDNEGSHVSHGNRNPGAEIHLKQMEQSSWDSFQFTEAMSVLNKFLKPRTAKCPNCKAKNPKITKPTFGWFESGLSGIEIRGNIIKSHGLDGLTGGSEERSISEVLNDNDSARENDPEAAESESDSSTSDGTKSTRVRRPSFETSVSQKFQKHKNTFSGPLLPTEVRDVLKHLWKAESSICSFICNLMSEQLYTTTKDAGHLMFFLDSVLVPPTKFRPPAKGGDSVMEHPHTVLLGKVLQSNISLGNAHQSHAERDKIVGRWKDLQQSINVLYNSKTAVGQSQMGSDGICQFLEKKEGIFRQKMMGKRVNFAARSVISPDPYLGVNEIGIPPYFALKLTYPEKVTSWNLAKLRKAIINGPDIHPGALACADKVSTIKLTQSRKARSTISRKLSSSRGVTQTGKNSEYEIEGKVVYRHLQDGDIVLVNRQPTLHKPSIMAHVVRVLKGEKTLRMHYANCSSYNADFDGDEMNVHFPQDEISRAEAYNIVNANEQYIVPTKGDTVRGLIQDHIVGAVLLTLKDTCLTKNEFNQLLYGSLACSGNISELVSQGIVQPGLPAYWKPLRWTGKQVISALLNHLTKGCAPCTVEKEMKIPREYLPSETVTNQPHSLLVWKNELVCGVIDKAQFGQFGLVHSVQELYGSNTAGFLLSALSRLCTIFLQMHGFTCGVEDLIILPSFDDERKEKLEGEDVGEGVHCDFVKKGPLKLQLEVEKVLSRDRESATALLDMKMKNKLTEKANKISKELLRQGLLKPFPKNCISLMTISGAKGSTVNFQQISSYLGQQELEGKRVPRMVSGKTLPCFPPWDFTSRAGGYITDRFLTGLRPQEYYFHCMAGREGLVDTAVKTSRSGYLQRCLIKNLESLKVCYDYTVRDADGSIVQFFYGEDGVDVHKTSFLKNLKALALNEETLRDKYKHEHEFNNYIVELPVQLEKQAKSFLEKSETEKLLKELESLKRLDLQEEWKKNEKSFLEQSEKLLKELKSLKKLDLQEEWGEREKRCIEEAKKELQEKKWLSPKELARKAEENLLGSVKERRTGFLKAVKERRNSFLKAVKGKAKSFLKAVKAEEFLEEANTELHKELEENENSSLKTLRGKVLPEELAKNAERVLEAVKMKERRVDAVKERRNSFLEAVKERRNSFVEAVKGKAKSFLEAAKAEELPEELEEQATSFLELVKKEDFLEEANAELLLELEEDEKSCLKTVKREVLPKELGEQAKCVLEAVKIQDLKQFLKLLTQKYLSSLAPAGEPVGVIAAQSIGEPSTQMTLNTFHLAGRGEMNVTLGIPRLQEILKTAAVVIKTPVLTCPFLQFKFKADAQSRVDEAMKITVAHIIETMEVHILPLSVHNNELSRIYKLRMTFKCHSLLSPEDCEETLSHGFLRGLEDAIENHIALLAKISGIKNYKSNSRPQENEMDEDVSLTSHGKESDVDEDGDGGDDDSDANADLGSDSQKRKQQATDEIDYEDASGDESADESEQGVAGESNDEHGIGEDEEIVNVDYEHASEIPNDEMEMSRHKSSDRTASPASKRRNRSRKIFVGKETDRHVFVEVKGGKFEAHFRFTNEPHILLAQIAQRTAKNVYIKSSGKISQCKLVEHDVSENSVIWDKEKVKLKDQFEDESYWALKAAGVDFTAFWEMQDELDVTRVYSNSVHAMLTTYGVEAARATIIREVKNVFGNYGVQVDSRHLSLIADYMTQTGGYRPMSRHGCVTDTLSPLSKMSFETASKFLVEAASFGMSDDLETPSARICLGLPVKMGTGCFDLMQQFEI
ncbi:OLC1v1004165C3 [Oldenlandia corymbosa var. corymbosa]|uniref:DNA-directed RNA polymerase subunit n=2 Tax=Oldenlandia corymbosa var. corymbosa TaxID=529605 RepID=A0AAV1DBX1_OLDCO|nr:OLC1v1004165C3 [Oldenlandia corymbosa var. corymbosa]